MDTSTNTIPVWAQSSADPTQMSATLEGFMKLMGGLIVTIGVWKGADPVLIQTQVGSVVAQFMTAAPAVYMAWHSSEALFGLFRKLSFKVGSAPVQK